MAPFVEHDFGCLIISWLYKLDILYDQGCRQASVIRQTPVGNKIADLIYQFRSRLNIWLQWNGQKQLQDQTRDI